MTGSASFRNAAILFGTGAQKKLSGPAMRKKIEQKIHFFFLGPCNAILCPYIGGKARLGAIHNGLENIEFTPISEIR